METNDQPSQESNPPINPQPEAMTSSPEHDLDSFRAGDLDPAGDDAGIILEADEAGEFNQAADEAGPEQLDKGAFWETWKIVWSLPASINPAFAPLAVQPENETGERAASDAIYRLLEIWYPSALMPQSETIGLALVAGPVLIGKAMIVREVLADRRVRQATPTNGGAGWLQ